MQYYFLLALGLLVFGLGFWSKSQGSLSWKKRVFSGFVITIGAIYMILST